MIADEVADVSNKEQLSIVLQYIDGAIMTVREDLVGFFECETRLLGPTKSRVNSRRIAANTNLIMEQANGKFG